MQFLTDFADQAVILPVSVLVALGLAASGWWRGLGAWLFAVLGVLGTMALLKYLFFACHAALAETDIASPSGHTAAAAVVWGGGLVLLLRGRVPGWAVVALPPAIAVLIGLSRIAVHAHVPPEVVLGGAIGLVGAGVLGLLAGPRPPLRVWPVLAATLVAVVALHGVRLNAESAIHSFWMFTWIPLPGVCRV